MKKPKISFFSSQRLEREYYSAWEDRFELNWIDTRLSAKTVALAKGSVAVSLFVEDKVCAQTAELLAAEGVKYLLLRSAGYNHVDLQSTQASGLRVARVPKYSPHAVAEHAAALLLSLVRKLPRAFSRVRDLNFSLEHLVGFDLNGKTIGVIGTGHIGTVFSQIMLGFGCHVLAHDPSENSHLKNLGVSYVDLKTLFQESHVISLHVPLLESTRHLIDEAAICEMRDDVLLINTSRGALIDTPALIQALKQSKIGGAAIDVYEEEEGVFFHDFSDTVLSDDQLARLLTFPNVIVTAHQAFLTQEALHAIAETTMNNLINFINEEDCENELK